MSHLSLPATIADLVAPMAADEFLALVRERRPYHQPGGGADKFAALFGWDRFIANLRAGLPTSDSVRLTRKGGQKVEDFLYKTGSRVKAEVVEQMLAAGASFVCNRIDRYVPEVKALCAAAAEQSGDFVSCGAIATTGAGGAFDLHYDELDLLIMQIDGAKNWRVYENPALNPVMGIVQEPADPASQPLIDVVLEPGDWLFVPAGYRHICDTKAERSLHLSMGYYPLTAPRALDLIVRDMLEQPSERAPIRDHGAAAEAALKAHLIARIEASSLADLSRRHRDTGIKPRG